MLHLGSGIFAADTIETVFDVVMRNNYFRNMANGIHYAYTQGDTRGVQRLIATNNIIEVANRGIGINLNGPAAYKRFNTLILRKNIIRSVRWDEPTPGTIASGVDITSVTDLNLENNLINNYAILADAIKYANYTNARLANNRNTQGVELT